MNTTNTLQAKADKPVLYDVKNSIKYPYMRAINT